MAVARYASNVQKYFPADDLFRERVIHIFIQKKFLIQLVYSEIVCKYKKNPHNSIFLKLQHQ